MNNSTETDTPPLYQAERQHEIAALVQERGRIEVAELSDRFGVTTETIRRDLSDLQRQQIVRRTHGGAVAWETPGFEPLVAVRNKQNDEEKRRLAQRAIDELPETGTAIIDSGSTLTRFAEAIPMSTSLRIVTNSLPTAHALAAKESVDVVVIGGKVRKNTLAMVDADAVAALQPITVDTAFICSDAASVHMGLTTPYREEAALKGAMIRAARRVVAIIDHSKFAGDQFIRFAEWSDIDVLVTNTEVDAGVVAAIEATGTTVLLA